MVRFTQMLNAPVTPINVIDSQESNAPMKDAAETARAFNTALLSSQSLLQGSQNRDIGAEILFLTKTPGFQALLRCIQNYATTSGLSEVAAASSLVETFRKMDSLWASLALQEGITQLRSIMNEPDPQN